MSRDDSPELLASAEVRAPAADRRVPGSSLADGLFWENLTISSRTHTGNRTRAALAKIDGETTRLGITTRGPWPYTDPPRPWVFDKCKHWLLEICGNVLAKLISLCTFGYCIDLDHILSKDIFFIVALVILLLRFMTTASLIHLQLCEMIVSPDSETVQVQYSLIINKRVLVILSPFGAK